MDNKIIRLKLGMVNAYLLKAGDGFILIDTGLPFQWTMLESQLMAAGCIPGNLKLIIITHGDWDHTGNVLRLKEKYKVRVAMNAADVPQAENGKMLKRKIRTFIYKMIFTFRMLTRKLQRKKMSYPKFTPDILLSDGQSLEQYGLKAKVIYIPGHTPGSIGVLTEEGELFAGDTFVNRFRPNIADIIENQEQLKDSLAKIRTLNVRMIYPGHGKPFPWEFVSEKTD